MERMGENLMFKFLQPQGENAHVQSCGRGWDWGGEKKQADNTYCSTLDFDKRRNNGKQFLIVCLKYSSEKAALFRVANQ